MIFVYSSEWANEESHRWCRNKRHDPQNLPSSKNCERVRLPGNHREPSFQFFSRRERARISLSSSLTLETISPRFQSRGFFSSERGRNITFSNNKWPSHLPRANRKERFTTDFSSIKVFLRIYHFCGDKPDLLIFSVSVARGLTGKTFHRSRHLPSSSRRRYLVIARKRCFSS